MSDQPLSPPPDEPPRAVVAATRRPRGKLLPWLCALGFLLLAGAIFYLWQYPSVPNETADNAAGLHAVDDRIADLNTRLSRLEQRPAPDLGGITARINALDGKTGDQTQVAAKLDTLSGRIEALSARFQSGSDASKQQLETLTNRVAKAESSAANLDAVGKRLNRVAKLGEASLALASGRPLGDLPNAPDALARYARAAPPTEAQLRLGFPQAEQAALAAKQPDATDAPFADRVWQRAQGLVTVRRDGDLMLGNPSATILSHAQGLLDAGDLAGAATMVETLKGPPAQAMAGWLMEAKALLNARSALADMANQA